MVFLLIRKTSRFSLRWGPRIIRPAEYTIVVYRVGYRAVPVGYVLFCRFFRQLSHPSTRGTMKLNGKLAVGAQQKRKGNSAVLQAGGTGVIHSLIQGPRSRGRAATQNRVPERLLETCRSEVRRSEPQRLSKSLKLFDVSLLA